MLFQLKSLLQITIFMLTNETLMKQLTVTKQMNKPMKQQTLRDINTLVPEH